MRILGIAGSHRRHLYFFAQLHRVYPLAALVVQEREAGVPDAPADIGEHDRANFIEHFARREAAERRYFGQPASGRLTSLAVTPATLNEMTTVDFVRETKPDVVILFGCNLIKSPLLDVLPEQTINLHLGLSPRYRGAATLFWPFYFLEPNHAGSTFHYIVQEPDAGDVVHQVVPELDRMDGIHDVACKTVVASVTHASELLARLHDTGRLERHRQIATGKSFLESDFRPEHLRMIYDACGDQTARMCLDGEIRPRPPRLFRQF